MALAGSGGCGSGASTPEESRNPYDFETDSGKLHVVVHSTPEPFEQGTNSAVFTLRDANGAPVDGVALGVTPWMPAMGHGSEPLVTSVTPQGNGVYQVDNIVFFMPGSWELRTTYAGAVNDRATLKFQIP